MKEEERGNRIGKRLMIWFHSVFKSERKYKAEIVIHHERQNLHSSSFFIPVRFPLPSLSLRFYRLISLTPTSSSSSNVHSGVLFYNHSKLLRFGSVLVVEESWREEDSNSITLYLFSHDKN